MRKSLVGRRHNATDLTPSDLFRGFFGPSIFDDFFDNSFLTGFGTGIRTDIQETDKEYIIEAELPGFSKEDINVQLHNGELIISAAREQTTSEERDNYIRKERYGGKLSRSFRIEGIKEDEITGEYKDGVLKILLPKSKDSQDNGRIINIR
ncbi:Hsp20/alpha crystallin family protein [Syntrophomonas erecta]